MKAKESTIIALKITAIFFIIIASFFAYFYFLYHVSILVLAVLLSFFSFISFWILQFYIERYIYDRIKVIYKIIHDHKLGKSNKNLKKKQSNESIESVHQEVLDWSQGYEEEISQLKELEKYRKEYIGNISHELKTPLFAILGYVSTLIDGGIDDDEINTKYLIKSEKNINRLVSIVNELEIINQLESGEIKLDITKFNLKELVDDTIESLELKAAERNIRIYYGKNYDQAIYTLADKNQIQKLITNLVGNAIKYGFNNTGKVKISFFDMDDKILVEVTDNGPGINKEDLSRIFERFYRTDKARSREQGGTGLGLAIVKHIIEAHKQTIYTRSTVGIGTTFGFTLEKV